MSQAIAELHAHIIPFLIRAREGYQESTPLHILHALTRPVELRCVEFIEDPEKCTRTIYSLASQAEQRDMHLELREMAKKQQASDAVLPEIRQIAIGMLKPRLLPEHRSLSTQALISTLINDYWICSHRKL